MQVNYPIAFISGIVSFFAPCIFPLIPAYIGYISGTSLKDLETFGVKTYYRKIILSSLFYILGFSITFVLLGSVAGGVGILLRRYDLWLMRIGGLIIFILGLKFAEFIKFPFLTHELKIRLPVWSEKLGYGRAFMIGIIFATTWTPCVGAVLGSILTLAAVSGTAFAGASLLFVYSLGISIPFLVISLILARVPIYVNLISRRIQIISRISGVILAILGLLLLTDTYKYLNAWLFGLAYSLGYQIK
jgi:cytochrome c-type biogenesis protein